MVKNTNDINKVISVAVIKNAAGKVLIVHRIREENTSDGKKLTWVFPGGKMVDGETPEEAVIREVSQETGFNVSVKSLISERDHPQLPVHLNYFECEIIPTKMNPISDIHEIDTLKWVLPEQLNEFVTTDIDSKVAAFLGI